MNLTIVSKYFRKGVVLLAILATVYYFGILFFFPSMRLIIEGVTKPKIPENPIYGQLPQLRFVEKPVVYPEGGPSFELNTTDGKLPKGLPNIVPVYKFIETPFSYQAGKNAIDDAASLGFIQDDLISDLKGDIYIWRNLKTGSVLRINIEDKNAYLTTNLRNKESFFVPNTLNEITARNHAIDQLNKVERFEEDSQYPTGFQKVTLGVINSGVVYPTRSVRDAQVAMVEFYRKVGESSIYGQDPSVGLLRIMVRKPEREANPLNTPFLSLNYKKFDSVSEATYPIISVSEAWDAVSKNKGVVTSVVASNAAFFENSASTSIEKVLVDTIEIAYYEPEDWVEYLQPIYIFSGKYVTRGTEGGTINIYYPAVKGEFIQKSE